jgi:hypothetical protein
MPSSKSRITVSITVGSYESAVPIATCACADAEADAASPPVASGVAVGGTVVAVGSAVAVAVGD